MNTQSNLIVLKVDNFCLKINHALFQIFIATDGNPITHTFISWKTGQTNARFITRIINWKDIKFDFFGGEGSHNKLGFSSGFTVQTTLGLIHSHHFHLEPLLPSTSHYLK